MLENLTATATLFIFIIKGFRTTVFIVISTTFQPICPPAFFRCLSNLGTYTNFVLYWIHGGRLFWFRKP